jgi:hypothetical protein
MKGSSICFAPTQVEEVRTISVDARRPRACGSSSLQVIGSCIMCLKCAQRSRFVIERNVRNFLSLNCSCFERRCVGSSSFCASQLRVDRLLGRMMDHFSRASDCAGQVSICQAGLLHVVRGSERGCRGIPPLTSGSIISFFVRNVRGCIIGCWQLRSVPGDPHCS